MHGGLLKYLFTVIYYLNVYRRCDSGIARYVYGTRYSYQIKKAEKSDIKSQKATNEVKLINKGNGVLCIGNKKEW